MRPNPLFQGLDKSFWAHIRSLSQELGYTARTTGTIKVPSLSEILKTMRALELLDDHLVKDGNPTEFAEKVLAYFEFRANILNNTVQHQLMDVTAAKAMYDRLLTTGQAFKLAPIMN